MTLTDDPTGTETAIDLDSIDFTDPHTFDDPWETYRALRDLDTLHYDAKNDFYVGARHEDVFTLSRDPETYCNKFGVRPKIAGDMSIITLDGDEHVRTRRLINQGFTPRRVRELIPHVRALTNEIVDQMAERGEVDFVERLRHPRAADHHQRDHGPRPRTAPPHVRAGPTR